VPNGDVSGQAAQNFRREQIGHVAHAPVEMEMTAVAGGDARTFLTAMLQRVQTQVGKIGGFRMAVDGEDAAFFVEFVERFVERDFVKHAPVRANFPERFPKPHGAYRLLNPPK
jgi:hypothetical protein